MHSLLFKPLRIGKIELKNRIVMVPVVARLGIEEQIAFYTARARGGVSLIQLPPGHVDPSATEGDTLGLCDDKDIVIFSRLVSAIREAGARVSVTLFHAGAQMRSNVAGTSIVGPSAIPWSKRAEVPRELTIAEIEELVGKFVKAAVIAEKAGCDFVELGAAHGYLISEFLSPRNNKRTDKYGGDAKGRAQFAVEIIQGIKKTVGRDFPVSCRMNGADNIEGGLTVEDTRVLAPILVNAGLDLISVSAGVYGAFPPVIPTYDIPHGCFIPLAESIKSAVNVPVIAVGRINDPLIAEEILKKGKADLVGMARPLVADPDLPDKICKGQLKEIRKCLACNACNVPHTPIRCTVNAAAGRETEFRITPAASRKHIMVIGGGPAGLEAARVSALRGHRVSLYEKENRLGGQWLLAAVPPHKQEFSELIDYEVNQLRKLNVKVTLGKSADAALVRKEKPDAVIIATGAVPKKFPIPDSGPIEVINAWDVLRGCSIPGNKILVVGGGSVGLETSLVLAEKGKEVVIIEMLAHIGIDMIAEVRWSLLNELNQHGIKIFRSARIEQINENDIIVNNNNSQETWKKFDTIVSATGSESLNEMEEALKGIVEDLYVIGDAVKPRKGVDAIQEGAEAGCKV